MNTGPETKPPNALLSSYFSCLGGIALREYPNVAQITKPPIRLFGALAELREPHPNRYVRVLNADLAEDALNLAEIYAKIIQQDRQLHELAIRSLTLEKFDLVQDIRQFEAVCVQNFREEANLPISFAKLTLPVGVHILLSPTTE